MTNKTPESWCCIDCGYNTASGWPDQKKMENLQNAGALAGKDSIKIEIIQSVDDELYTVRPHIWKAAGMELYGGCLCIGCLEKRLGRMLKRKDFIRNDPFASSLGTKRLMARRSGKRIAA